MQQGPGPKKRITSLTTNEELCLTTNYFVMRVAAHGLLTMFLPSLGIGGEDVCNMARAPRKE